MFTYLNKQKKKPRNPLNPVITAWMYSGIGIRPHWQVSDLGITARKADGRAARPSHQEIQDLHWDAISSLSFVQKGQRITLNCFHLQNSINLIRKICSRLQSYSKRPSNFLHVYSLSVGLFVHPAGKVHLPELPTSVFTLTFFLVRRIPIFLRVALKPTKRIYFQDSLAAIYSYRTQIWLIRCMQKLPERPFLSPPSSLLPKIQKGWLQFKWSSWTVRGCARNDRANEKEQTMSLMTLEPPH